MAPRLVQKRPESKLRPMAAAALLAWFGFVFISFALDAAPFLNISVAATLVALFAAVITRRQLDGKPALPAAVMALLGVGAFVIYVRWFLHTRPRGLHFLLAGFVCFLPVLMLVIAFRQWRSRSRA